MATIYKITNTINGKPYIGKTTASIARRWAQHKSDAKRGRTNARLYNAMRKYGFGEFVIEHLETGVPDSEINQREMFYISLYDSQNPEHGYNVTVGGDGTGSGANHPSFGKPNGRLGKKMSDEARRNMRLGHLGKRQSQEHRLHISQSLQGIKRSKETRRRQSEGKLLAIRDGRITFKRGADHHSFKTHCIRGHKYTPENTFIGGVRGGRKRRMCKSCMMIRAKNRATEKK